MSNKLILNFSKNPKIKIFLPLLFFILYILVFIFFRGIIGDSVGAISFLPIISMAWYWGILPGFISCCFIFFINVFLYGFNAQNIISSLPPFLSSIIVAIGFGWLSNLYKTVRDQQKSISNHIVERKSIEEELFISESKYKNLVDSINEIIFQTDINGKILFVNSSWQRIFGFPQNITIGNFLSSYVNNEDKDEFVKFFDYDYLLANNDFTKTFRFNTAADEVKWVEINVSLYRNNKNNILGFTGLLKDITNLKLVGDSLNFRADYEDLITIISTTFINIEISEIDSNIFNALSLIGQFIESDRSYVFIFDENKKYINIIHEWCAKNISPKLSYFEHFEIKQIPYIMAKLESFESLYIDDVNELPDEGIYEKTVLQKFGITSCVIVPMIFSNGLIGMMGFDFNSKKVTLNSQSIQLLNVTSDIFANAIIRKKREEEIRSLNQELEHRVFERTAQLQNTIQKLNQEISEKEKIENDLQSRVYRLQMLKILYEKFEVVKDLNSVYQSLYEHLSTYKNISRVSLLLYDEKLNMLISDNMIGINRTEKIQSAPQQLGSSISGKCFSESKVIFIPNTEESEIIPHKFIDYYDLKTVVALPIIFKNKTMGVLRIDNTKLYYAFNDEDIEFFEMVAEILGIVVANIKLFQENKSIVESLSESEARYKNLFEANPDPIFVIDNFNCNILNVNKAAIQIYGYSKEDFLHMNISQLHFEGEQDEILQYYSDTSTNFRVFRHLLKNGSDIYAEVSFHNILYGNRNAKLILVNDITKRKKAEEEVVKYIAELQASKDLIENNALELTKLNKKLVESENQLKQLNSSKDRFFSILSHDLRSPFNALLGFSEFLINDLDTLSKNEIKLFATNINKSSRNLVNLLNNVLEWSRIQTGRLINKPLKLSASEVTEDVISLLIGNALKKSIKLKKIFDDNISIYADKNAFTSIMQNLITNAIKFSFEGSEVLIKAKQKGDFAEFQIEDHGVGIKSNDLENLFKIDFNHTTKGTSNEEGTGLGLVLCKELVEKNGGSISIESEPKVKTVVKFSLPVFKE